MKHFDAAPHHLSIESPQPPAPLSDGARAIALMKIRRNRHWHRKLLIRQQPILVLPILTRQRPRQFPGVARNAPGGNNQRGGIEGGYHKGYKESVGYLTWAM